MEPRAGARGECLVSLKLNRPPQNFNGASRRSARRERELQREHIRTLHFNGASRRSARREWIDKATQQKRSILLQWSLAPEREESDQTTADRLEPKLTSMEPRAGARGEGNGGDVDWLAMIALQWSLAPEREERRKREQKNSGQTLLQWSLAPEREERRQIRERVRRRLFYFNGASRRSARRAGLGSAGFAAGIPYFNGASRRSARRVVPSS